MPRKKKTAADAELDALKMMQGNTKPVERVLTSWKSIDTKDLRFGGVLYDGWTIEVKKIQARDMQWIASLKFPEENTVESITQLNVSIIKLLNYLMGSCVRLKNGGTVVNGDHIYSFDKLQLALLIREWSDIDAPLFFETKCPHCGHTDKVTIDSDTQKDKESSLMKYIKGEKFVINNPSLSNVWYYEPPTILEENQAMEFSLKLTKEGVEQQIIETFGNFLPFLRDETEHLSIQKMWKKYLLLDNQQVKELSFLAPHALIGNSEVSHKCSSCFREYDTTLNIDNWSDFTGRTTFEL